MDKQKILALKRTLREATGAESLEDAIIELIKRCNRIEKRLAAVEGTAARVAHRTRGMDVIGPGPMYTRK